MKKIILGKHSRTASRTIIYIILILFFLFTVGPLLWLISLSVKTQLQAFANPPVIFFLPTWDNYRRLFMETDFLRFFMNSLIISTSATALCLVIGTPAAFGLVRMKSKAKNVILSWIILMRMAPAMTFVIPFFIAFSQTNLIDSRIGLIISYFTFNLPLVIWLMRSFFIDISESLEEAATIDGASVLQTFSKVIIPITLPGIASAGILTFIMCWNEFIFALILTRNKAVTAAIGIVNLMKYEGTEWGMMGAGAVILIIPAILIAFLVGKSLVQGLTKGALKE
ncbi:MAG: carbohydrate ABC transporter permease [Bacteroidetes bacterium]|nr:carbohydrate ABC transporter permease [Bacteroidota bacterium]